MKERFIVENEICFIKLINQGKGNIGLILQGATQMEEFCKEAIQAYEELLHNKGKKGRMDRILDGDEKK